MEDLTDDIEAIEKQIPKKPVPNKEYYDNGNWCWHRTCCPNCKTPMDSFNKFKHCDNCEQAIDWSDEE